MNTTCAHTNPASITACPACLQRVSAADTLADLRAFFARADGSNDLVCELLRAAETALMGDDVKAGNLAVAAVGANRSPSAPVKNRRALRAVLNATDRRIADRW